MQPSGHTRFYTTLTDATFWSWQSDLDSRVTRNLVRDALASAIEDLEIELEERDELTSDTKGVAGSPDIVATILAKIDAAKVFVGDVTPIAVAANGKALANPNVLIELGYAKRAIGLERVITVWNTAYPGASVEQLPFDMRGRRGPMSFHLPVGASTEELRKERDRLRVGLREALRASIAVATPTLPEPVPPNWQPTFPGNPALWFDPAKRLTINEDGVPGSKAMLAGPYGYVRIRPRRWSAPQESYQDSVRPRIMGRTNGYSWGMTKGGFLVYGGTIRTSEDWPLTNCVMQFRGSGEIWGIDPYIADREDRALFFADALIGHANDFIRGNLEVLNNQGAEGPFNIILGATDLEGLHWISNTRWGGQPVALEASAQAEFTLKSFGEDERMTGLEGAWGEIAAAFGIAQPPRATLEEQIRSS